LKNIHLSYHDGNHYNSVRLLNDVAEDIPPEISEDIIKGIQQTTDSTALNENEENGNDEEDNKNEEVLKTEEEVKEIIKEVPKKRNNENMMRYKGTDIKDACEKNKKKEI